MCPDRLGGVFELGRDAEHKLNILGRGEGIEPGHETVERVNRLVTDKLIEVVDKDMGDIVVARVQAADKAL